MRQYGEDFRSGRYTRARNHYDGRHQSAPRSGGRWDAHLGPGGGRFEGEADPRSRGGLDESWSSMAHGRGRPDFDGQHRRTRGSMLAERFRGSLPGSWAGARQPYDHGYQRFGGRVGHDYDQDFGERVRRGWNRIRSEAREWMGGRGYDRAW